MSTVRKWIFGLGATVGFPNIACVFGFGLPGDSAATDSETSDATTEGGTGTPSSSSTAGPSTCEKSQKWDQEPQCFCPTGCKGCQDLTEWCAEFEFSEICKLESFEVMVEIVTDYAGDVALVLKSPKGIGVKLLDRPGYPERPEGTPASFSYPVTFVWPEEANVPTEIPACWDEDLEEICDPAGDCQEVAQDCRFTPIDENADALLGQDLQGTWMVCIAHTDMTPDDSIEVRQMHLTLRGTP